METALCKPATQHAARERYQISTHIRIAAPRATGPRENFPDAESDGPPLCHLYLRVVNH